MLNFAILEPDKFFNESNSTTFKTTSGLIAGKVELGLVMKGDPAEDVICLGESYTECY